MTSYSDLVGGYADELIRLRDYETEIYWRTGDIANELIDLHPSEHKLFVHAAVGSFRGKSARTVREYADNAKFYSTDVRLEFGALSAAHFRFAYKKDNWREILEYSLAPEGISRPASMEDVVSKFANSPQADPVLKFINDLHANYEKIQDKITLDQKSRLDYLMNEITDVLSPPLSVVVQNEWQPISAQIVGIDKTMELVN